VTPAEAASFCWSLARIGCPVTPTDTAADEAAAAATTALAAVLERHVEQMTLYELAWTLWALGRLGWTWAFISASSGQLGPRLLRALEAAMQQPDGGDGDGDGEGEGEGGAGAALGLDPREVGVALWAVGRLQVPVNDLSLSLRTALLAGLDSMVMALQPKMLV
jgi:hypothetical protein